jgi:putative ABC transport system permease protein
VKPINALRLYRVRLRARIVQECLAVLGIAAGVALLFASQVSSSSLQSSVGALEQGIDGNATLQLLARDPHGFPESVLAKVRATPGVRVAAPLIEAGANALGPRGSASVQLVGADETLSALRGKLVRDTALAPFGGVEAVVLPSQLAQALGTTKFGDEVTLQTAGRSSQVPLYAVLGRHQIGTLSSTPVAVAPLFFVQQATGLTGRITRILVAPRAGAQARVRAALTRIAAGHMNVEPAGYEGRLFAQAATASSQSAALFSAISALVGFLFAFNAVLLTVPQRRRLVADLRHDGYTPLTVIGVLLLDACALGALGSALGLVLGEELSIHLFHSEPAFLSLAFAIGSQRAVSAQTLALAIAGGMGAAVVAVLSPLRDVLARDPLAAVAPPRETASSPSAGGLLALVGLACLAGATALLLRAPEASMPAMVLLVTSLLCQLPLVLSVALGVLKRAAGLLRSPVGHVATMELHAAGQRAVAVAAIGAVAVFGSVVIEGAHDDLLAGLEGSTRDSSAVADLWVAPAGAYDLLHTAPFPADRLGALRSLPGIRSVSLYRGGLLDYGDRRVRVIAPPAGVSSLLASGQVISGDPSIVNARLRTGRWLAISQALANAHSLGIGDPVTLPTPVPTRMRVAAISTNLGWAPGAVVMSSAAYAHAWGSADASAYSIRLEPGYPLARAVSELRGALGGGSGMVVRTSAEQAAAEISVSREALQRLTQITTMIPIVAVLAMAAAIGALVWQRRPRLAKLKLEGIARGELWLTTLLESAVLLGVGCLTGAVFGLYGQRLADRALALAINFPVTPSMALAVALFSVALVCGAALAILALPGYLASSVPAALALQD